MLKSAAPICPQPSNTFNIMKAIAAMLMAAAAATAAAGAIDGPCTLRSVPEVTKGKYCPASFLACMSSVTLAPSNSSAVNVTMGAAGCFSGDPIANEFGDGAAIQVISGSSSIVLTGSDRYAKGFAEFHLNNGTSADTLCSGSFAVDSGTCLFSDQGPDPPGPQAKGPCTMVLESAQGPKCAEITPCLQSVSLSAGLVSNVNVTLSGSTCDVTRTEFEVDSEKAQVTAHIGSSGVGFQGETDSDQTLVSFSYYTSSGDSDECFGMMRVTAGECLYSDQGPMPPTDPVLVGPCSLQLQSSTDACPADVKSCLSQVDVSMMPGGGSKVSMPQSNASCYDGRVNSLLLNQVGVLMLPELGTSRMRGFLFGGQSMFQGSVNVGLSPEDNPVRGPSAFPSNGSWALNSTEYPCQAMLTVESGSCLYSNVAPLPSPPPNPSPAATTPTPAAATSPGGMASIMSMVLCASMGVLLSRL